MYELVTLLFIVITLVLLKYGPITVFGWGYVLLKRPKLVTVPYETFKLILDLSDGYGGVLSKRVKIRSNGLITISYVDALNKTRAIILYASDTVMTCSIDVNVIEVNPYVGRVISK